MMVGFDGAPAAPFPSPSERTFPPLRSQAAPNPQALKQRLIAKLRVIETAVTTKRGLQPEQREGNDLRGQDQISPATTFAVAPASKISRERRMPLLPSRCDSHRIPLAVSRCLSATVIPGARLRMGSSPSPRQSGGTPFFPRPHSCLSVSLGSSSACRLIGDVSDRRPAATASPATWMWLRSIADTSCERKSVVTSARRVVR